MLHFLLEVTGGKTECDLVFKIPYIHPGGILGIVTKNGDVASLSPLQMV